MKIFITVIILLLTSIAFSQSFKLTISSGEDEVLTDALEDSDGNFVLCGSIGDFILDEYDGYLVKVNQAGDTILTKRFSNAYTYIKFDAIVEQMDGYIAFGSAIIDGTGNLNLILKKTDKDLNELWTKTFKNTSYTDEYFRNAKIDGAGNLIAIGEAGHIVNILDFFMYKFNSFGDSINAKYYSFPGMQLGFDIIEKPDSGYKVFTFLTPDGSPLLGNEAVNIDVNLNITSIVSIDTFPPNDIGSAFYSNTRAKWINDSVYVAGARVINVEYGGQNTNKSKGVGLLFLNDNDSILDAYVFGKSDTSEIEAISGMDFVYSSAIYVGGTSDYNNWLSFPSFGNEKNWFNLNKIDSAGNIEWNKWYGGDANYYLWNVLATQDEGCFMAGTRYDSTASGGIEERDIYIIKVGPDGLLVSEDETSVLPEATYNIYPNPASGHFYIQGNFALPATIELYDLTGRQVSLQSVTSNRQRVDVSQLAEGLYVYQLLSDGKVARGKVVIE